MNETQIGIIIDQMLTRYKSSEIKYHPYATGSVDIYNQREKTFGTPVVLIGRAILDPTKEQVTLIGNGEEYEIAFLFSRLEMRRKFPLADEGKWIDSAGQMEWWSNRYKLEKVQPTGQVGLYFHMMVALGRSLQGARES